MKVKIKKLTDNAITPTYAHTGDACFDLFAIETKCIRPGHTTVIETGLAFEVPGGHAMFIFSRSGHGFKHGIRLCNSTGIGDAGYRGSVAIGLRNDSKEAYYVSVGDRIAQAIILPYPYIEFELADELSDTERGTGGFGSSGT